MKKLGFLLTLIAILALACAPAEEPAEEAAAAEPEEAMAPEEEMDMAPTAVAVLRNAEGAEVGTATFVQAKSAVILTAEVEGVERDGPHGFHVHETGECTPPDFTSAGGHFNPAGTEHGCPDNPDRHAGDFGNIEIVGGAGTLELPSDLVTVTPGPTSIVGKAVLLHDGVDDCTSQPTGAAGARLGCGLIELAMAEGGEGGG